MTEKKRPSVAEILAAARKNAPAGTEAAGGSTPAASSAAPEAAPAEAVSSEAASSEVAATEATQPRAGSESPKPAAPKPAAAGGARPSVKDILAAARSGAGAPAAEKPAVAEKPAAAAKPDAKPAPKPAAAKPAAAKPAAEVAASGGARNTASILAAARGGSKPGPISKAELEAKASPAPEAKPAKGTVPPMPAKPQYAQKKAPQPAAGTTRRGFFDLALGSFLGLGFTSVALTSALWTLGTARFLFPNILTEPPSRFKVGFPADFAPGAVSTKFVAQYGVWVVNGEYQGQPMIYALKTVCTHLGCTPNWLEAEQKFKCPCHGSGFYKDGINFEGPAPRPLERYAIKLADDGQIEIDKSKTFQEEMGQWANAASFVAV